MRHYTPDRRGFAEIGRSPELQKVVEEAAQKGADYANSVAGSHRYRVEPVDVSAGYANETRAGAAIIDDAADALAVEGETHALDRAVPVVEAWGS